jgi:D-lyxose ketol-isomerase
MKRSDINKAIDGAIAFFKERRFYLPSFAYWTPEEWLKKGPGCNEIRDLCLGWDITDFGSGDFLRKGRVIFTLRNGRIGITAGKSYAQKVMHLRKGQRSPVHYHKNKMEDIINYGGGNITIRLWLLNSTAGLSTSPLEVSLDGVIHRVSTDEEIYLKPGESICVRPLTCHQFWSREGTGDALSMEISGVCDDISDNCWMEPAIRFPEITEDEARRYLLCNEYPMPRVAPKASLAPSWWQNLPE